MWPHLEFIKHKSASSWKRWEFTAYLLPFAPFNKVILSLTGVNESSRVMAYSSLFPPSSSQWRYRHVMASIEMLSEASLLKWLVEVLMKELQRNLSPRYTNLLKSQTHLLCTKTWRASKFSHLFNPPCNSQGACFAPSIKYLYPSFMVRFYFTTCSSYQSVSKPTNGQNNIDLQVIFCKIHG